MDVRPQMSPDEPLALANSTARADLTFLFLVLSGGLMVGAILHQKEPIYGANDASRWDTVYYLVEHGKYEFVRDHGAWWGNAKPQLPRDIPPFATIDMIRIVDAQGRDHYYSSKPPFLPTCLAGVVLLIEKATFGAADFRLHPWFITRTTLILVQVLPLLVAFWLIRRHILRDDDPLFVRKFCLATVTLGTYLTAWAVTLNNHVIAAAACTFAAHAMIRIWYDERRQWYWFALAGFFGAFTAATELPAGLLAVAFMVLMFCKDRRRTLSAAVPAALVPAAVFICTNLLATGRILPAYTEVYKPGGWYDFPGSYWSNPTGIDALSEPKVVYVLNMLVGHHGFFSLTPVLMICLAGMIVQVSRAESTRRGQAALVLLLTAAVAGVYACTTKNYGGLCEGLRWLLWLVPLWLLFLAEPVRTLARTRAGRFLCYAALAVSAISMADALPRPWSPSWLHRIFQQLHWVSY